MAVAEDPEVEELDQAELALFMCVFDSGPPNTLLGHSAGLRTPAARPCAARLIAEKHAVSRGAGSGYRSAKTPWRKSGRARSAPRRRHGPWAPPSPARSRRRRTARTARTVATSGPARASGAALPHVLLRSLSELVQWHQLGALASGCALHGGGLSRRISRLEAAMGAQWRRLWQMQRAHSPCLVVSAEWRRSRSLARASRGAARSA